MLPPHLVHLPPEPRYCMQEASTPPPCTAQAIQPPLPCNDQMPTLPPVFRYASPEIRSAQSPRPTHPMQTRARSGILKPITKLNLSATTTISPIPKSYRSALKDPHWHNAMLDEYNALMRNNTWCLVPKPAGVHVFFLEHAGELRIIILKERKVRNGPKYNAKQAKNKKEKTVQPHALGIALTLAKADRSPRLSSCFAPAIYQHSTSSKKSL
jgi:hypothetical protein